jgi:peptidoglycan/xylan/chitin deacetylase (PgdA/CDA1 family)
MANWMRTGRAREAGLRTGGMPPVLMYHSVSPYQPEAFQLIVSPARFEQQMRWLRRRGLRGVSVGDLLAARRRGGGRRLVGLTFDDGYADFAEYVVPVLTSHGFTATVFVVAGRLGGDNAWSVAGPRKTLLTADEVREAATAGMEIGSHGFQHLALPTVAGAGLATETVASRDVLRQVSGQDVAGFCYPYGSIERRVIQGVKEAGYDYACAIWPSAYTGRHALPRIFIGNHDSPSRLWAKGVWYWLALSYQGPGADRIGPAAVTMARYQQPAARR